MVTISEIAQKAGVCPSTVSRVLNNKAPNNSVETCEKIKRIAAQMGYRRNVFASSVRSGKFNSIGLLHSSVPLHSKIPEEFRSRLCYQTSRKNLLFLMGQMDEVTLGQAQTTPKILKEWAVDGLLFFYTHGDWAPLEEMLERSRLPVIWINYKMPHNCVYPDDQTVGEMAAEYLISKGHRKIGCYSHACDGHYSEKIRWDGFVSGGKKSGCRIADFRADRNYGKTDRMDCAHRLLQNLNGVSGLFCYGPTEAAALYLAAARTGIRIPDDLELIVVHSEAADVNGIPVPTLMLPYDGAIADSALTMLEKLIAGDGKLKSRAIKPVLITNERG